MLSVVNIYRVYEPLFELFWSVLGLRSGRQELDAIMT